MALSPTARILEALAIDSPALRCRIALNPGLAEALAGWLPMRLADAKKSKIRDPLDFTLAVFKNPSRFGFVEDGGGKWIGPGRW